MAISIQSSLPGNRARTTSDASRRSSLIRVSASTFASTAVSPGGTALVAACASWERAACFRRGPVRTTDADGRRAENRLGRRIARRLVQRQKREQVGELLFVEHVFDSLGHHRELADSRVLNVIARHGDLAAAGHSQHDLLFTVLDDQARQVTAVLGHHGHALVAGADDQAGVEDADHDLVEGASAAAGQIGPDAVPFTVDRVTLGAERLEDSLPGHRIAEIFAEIVAHFGDDLFALGIALLRGLFRRPFPRPRSPRDRCCP